MKGQQRTNEIDKTRKSAQNYADTISQTKKQDLDRKRKTMGNVPFENNKPKEKVPPNQTPIPEKVTPIPEKVFHLNVII